MSKKIHTLAGFSSDNEEQQEGEEGQAFYAGGSETSGQQILGPSKKKDSNKLVEDLFRKARDAGAQEARRDEDEEDVSSKAVSGYRLGDGSGPSEFIPNRTRTKRAYILKLWSNGFTVDNGPLRVYSEPQNKKFLESVERGLVPDDLIREAEGAEINLDMEDHRTEEFVPPKPAYVLYNEGYKLGSPVPKITTNASPNDMKNNEDIAKRNLNTNESEPLTNIQIRLADGSRLVVKANQRHTIKDLRNYLITARPEYQSARFSLNTNFPSREIQNENESLLDAKLLNSVIIQKLL